MTQANNCGLLICITKVKNGALFICIDHQGQKQCIIHLLLFLNLKTKTKKCTLPLYKKKGKHQAPDYLGQAQWWANTTLDNTPSTWPQTNTTLDNTKYLPMSQHNLGQHQTLVHEPKQPWTTPSTCPRANTNLDNTPSTCSWVNTTLDNTPSTCPWVNTTLDNTPSTCPRTNTTLDNTKHLPTLGHLHPKCTSTCTYPLTTLDNTKHLPTSQHHCGQHQAPAQEPTQPWNNTKHLPTS